MTHELYTPKLGQLRQQLKAFEGRPNTDKDRKSLRSQIKKLEKTEVGPRLASLREKLKSRKGKKEYAKSVEGIKAEIARLEKIDNGGVKSHD